ncbi:hypothetical protein [Aliiglaciecola litoralis]|uniref:Solute:sodium symporter small subunit n=1 Tax=Aliiglaciecola litoralis TaxID=582857 RepID=A0ABN1LFH0_9ALTE
MQKEAPTKLIILWQAGGVVFAWALTVLGILSGSLYVPFENEFININTDTESFSLAVSIYMLLSTLLTVLTYSNYRKLNQHNDK